MISGHNQLILTASTSKRFFRWLIFLKNPVKTHAQKPVIDVGGFYHAGRMYKIGHQHLKMVTNIPNEASDVRDK